MTSATAENDTSQDSFREPTTGFEGATAKSTPGAEYNPNSVVSRAAQAVSGSAPQPGTPEASRIASEYAANQSAAASTPTTGAEIGSPKDMTVSASGPPGRQQGMNDRGIGGTGAVPTGTTDRASFSGTGEAKPGLTTEQVNSNARAEMGAMDARRAEADQAGRQQGLTTAALQGAEKNAADAAFADKTGDRLATRGHWGYTRAAVAASGRANELAQGRLAAAQTQNANAGKQNFVQDEAVRQNTLQGWQRGNTAESLGNQRIAAGQQEQQLAQFKIGHEQVMADLQKRSLAGDPQANALLNAYMQASQGKGAPSPGQLAEMFSHASGLVGQMGQTLDPAKWLQGIQGILGGGQAASAPPEDWMARRRAENPGMSDQDIASHYKP